VGKPKEKARTLKAFGNSGVCSLRFEKKGEKICFERNSILRRCIEKKNDIVFSSQK